MTFCLWLVCTLVAVIGSILAVLAGHLAGALARRSAAKLAVAEPVTVLKPLYGAEPGLYSNLSSFCEQDYPGPIEMVCGVQDPSDTAVAIVHMLSERYPAVRIRLAAGSTVKAGNPKISNVINMYPEASHDVLILSDSDMAVGRDYLCKVVASLQQPDVGLVTCFYRGQPIAGFWSRLAAAAVDQNFLPSVLVGLRFGLAKPCFGSTIALRRATLERIGGFEAFADVLADDYAIGDAVRRLGAQVALPPFTIGHAFAERTLGEVIAHELRWARTIRLVDPAGYVGSVVTHPFPFALAALLLSGLSATGFIILAATLACRLFVPIKVERLPGGGKSALLLTPLRDLLSFGIFLASFLPGNIIWRDHRYRVGSDGTVTPA